MEGEHSPSSSYKNRIVFTILVSCSSEAYCDRSVRYEVSINKCEHCVRINRLKQTFETSAEFQHTWYCVQLLRLFSNIAQKEIKVGG